MTVPPNIGTPLWLSTVTYCLTMPFLHAVLQQQGLLEPVSHCKLIHYPISNLATFDNAVHIIPRRPFSTAIMVEE